MMALLGACDMTSGYHQSLGYTIGRACGTIHKIANTDVPLVIRKQGCCGEKS